MAEASTPKLAEWREACADGGLIPAAPTARAEKAMQRIVSRLLDAGLVGKGVGRGIYIPIDGDDIT